MALMASVMSDMGHDKVNLSSIPKSQLIDMIERLNKKLSMYKNQEE